MLRRLKSQISLRLFKPKKTIIYMLFDRDPEHPEDCIISPHKSLLGAMGAAFEDYEGDLEWKQPPDAFYWEANNQFTIEFYELED